MVSQLKMTTEMYDRLRGLLDELRTHCRNIADEETLKKINFNNLIRTLITYALEDDPPFTIAEIVDDIRATGMMRGRPTADE